MFGRSDGKSGKQVWNAFFAKSVEIEGSLRFSGLLNIDGVLTGAIVAKGMLVTGTSAIVTGDVFVENLILSGEVNGNIYATGEVHLNNTARVRGNINYHTLSVVPGAVLEGNSHQFSESEREELTTRIQAELGDKDAAEPRVKNDDAKKKDKKAREKIEHFPNEKDAPRLSPAE
jgi:cytoskeletal protein CcmA (bactofilin family)